MSIISNLGIILNLILLSTGSIYGSVYLNKRYEEMLPLTVMSIVFSLFIFYMLNIIKIGYYILILCSIVIFLISLRKFIKEKKIRKQVIVNFFTPGLLIFTIVTFIIFLITKDNYVMYFDELRMWGAYPKSIFHSQKLMIGNDLYFSTDYYPGMPLFQYFFAMNIGRFQEGHLFLSYSLFILALIMPITKRIKWKNYWAIIPCIILLFTFPMFFANNGFDGLYYYRTLFIDPAVGFTFGYSLYLSMKDFKNNKFEYILFVLSLSMIILMKVIGVVLAIVVLVSYLFNQLFIYKNFSFKLEKKIRRKKIIELLIPVLIVIFTFLSWQITYKINFNLESNNVVLNSKIKELLQLLFFPTDIQREFFKTYFTYINDNSFLINSSVFSKYLTMPNVILSYIVILTIIYFSIKKENKKIILSVIFFGIISIIAILSLYLYGYSFLWNNTVLCYGRYIGTVVIGLSLLILLLIFEVSDKLKRRELYYFLISILLIFYIYNFPKVSEYKYAPEFEIKTNEFKEKILSVVNNDGKETNLMTLYNYCDTQYTCVLYQHHLYLSLMDYDIISTRIFLASTITAAPEFYIPLFNNDIKYHLKNWDYVLVVEDLENPDDETKELFGDKPKSGELFKKILNTDGTFSMEKVSS